MTAPKDRDIRPLAETRAKPLSRLIPGGRHMYCQECRAENSPRARFCKECGLPLAARCEECDAELPAKAKFCPACGFRLAAAAVPETAPSGVPPRRVEEPNPSADRSE